MRGVSGLLWMGALLLAGCRIDENIGRDFPGPQCDCNSYFPMCVGAEWTYTVTDPTNGDDLGLKVLKFTAFEEHSDDPILDGLKNVFIQQRVTPLDRKLSSLVHDEGRILWLKDDFADKEGNLKIERHFSPGKIRLDESRTSDGDWPQGEQYVETKTSYDTTPPTTKMFDHTVRWGTSHEATPDGAWTDTLCQHKLDSSTEGGVTNAKYCFVRGVGKVYELTLQQTEEKLVDRTIPGCH